jgi:hypothetical protein
VHSLPESEIITAQSIVGWPVFSTGFTAAFEPITGSKCSLPESQGSLGEDGPIIF